MLQIKHLKKTYINHQKTLVFSDLNLTVKRGEIVALFGPNGCGKTTLLQIIADLVPYDSGVLTFDGFPTSNQKIGYIFQDYRNSLFPWLTASENIAFPLKIKKEFHFSQKEINKIVKTLYQNFGGDLPLNAYPYELSGGQQQLVSFLRGLVIEPELYLLDEPFSSLDYQTTLVLLEKLAKILRKTKVTTLVISHEIDEAIFLSQKIVLLSRKPTQVLKIFPNPIPFPRKISIIGSPGFAKIKREILRNYTKEIFNN